MKKKEESKISMTKVVVVVYHCDSCGTDSQLIDATNAELEKSGVYYCIHCGKNGKSFYSYDDYIVYKKS